MNRSKSGEQYVFLLGLIALFVWTLADFLKPLTLGLLLSLVLYPLHRRIEKKLRFKGPLAAFIATLGLCIGVLLPVIYLSIVVVNDGISFLRFLSEQSLDQNDPHSLGALLDAFSSKLAEHVHVTKPELIATFKNMIGRGGTFVAETLGGYATNVPSFILNFLIFILSLFVGLSEGPEILDTIRDVLPFDSSETNRFFKTTQNITSGVVLGSLASGIAQALVYGIAFLCLGIPRPLFFGTMAFVFSFIPVISSSPIGIGGIIYLMATKHFGPMIAMIVVFVAAISVDNLIRPMVIKGKASLHPLLAFLSVLGGIATFGFAGLFIGPLLAALSVVAFDFFSAKKLGAKVSKPAT